MINFIIISAIVLSIAIGYKTKLNVGLIALAFSYLVGCFVLIIYHNKCNINKLIANQLC
ncbi:hypothetical protein [Peptoniphilus asaccharolyticus]|uniref:hypothetical protein n=1 Tax=Peptoniphilus asaccharolyticus TaxID=1258 RepID=UPI0009FB9C65|nr:hypothetical protein [Peptoniphilus asaccharolyticus]